MRYALMRSKDIINGPGCRTSIYLQGCHFHCKDVSIKVLGILWVVKN